MSRTVVKIAISLSRLLALRRGPSLAGRAGHHAIRGVAGLECSNAFNADTSSRSSCTAGSANPRLTQRRAAHTLTERVTPMVEKKARRGELGCGRRAFQFAVRGKYQ